MMLTVAHYLIELPVTISVDACVFDECSWKEWRLLEKVVQSPVVCPPHALSKKQSL